MKGGESGCLSSFCEVELGTTLDSVAIVVGEKGVASVFRPLVAGTGTIVGLDVAKAEAEDIASGVEGGAVVAVAV